MIFAGIVAGGTGSRMGAEIPKQFLEIGGKPIIIHTVLKFIKIKRIKKIYIGVHSDWLEYCNKLIGKYKLDNERITVLCGGSDRNETVFKIVEEIIKEHGENKDDIILTHDAVRPFVSKEIIDSNINCALKHGVCGTYIKAVDTIIKSSDAKTVSDNPNRNEMFQAQTPQSFNISRLRNVYNSITDNEKLKLTDTCSIFTLKGYPVFIVDGDVKNIKITTKTDLIIAQAIEQNASLIL